MKLGLVGGYGLDQLLEESERESHSAEYDSEKINGELPTFTVIRGDFKSHEVLIIPCHGIEHKFPPHNVPFKSYFQFFSEEAVDYVLTTNSIGVMREDYQLPCLFLIDDFVNESKEVTYYDKFPEEPVHVNLSEPYDSELKQKVLQACQQLNLEIETGVTYVNSHGPRFETASEIKNKYSKLGEVIGMTGALEAILANEKKIPIASIGMGANWAEGVGGEQVEFEEVKKRTEEMQEQVYSVIKQVLKDF